MFGTPWIVLLQIIDGATPVTRVTAGPNTGQGTYMITLPTNALEVSIDPAHGYALPYETNINWSLIAGN